jgi:hypothetical protein
MLMIICSWIKNLKFNVNSSYIFGFLNFYIVPFLLMSQVFKVWISECRSFLVTHYGNHILGHYYCKSMLSINSQLVSKLVVSISSKLVVRACWACSYSSNVRACSALTHQCKCIASYVGCYAWRNMNTHHSNKRRNACRNFCPRTRGTPQEPEVCDLQRPQLQKKQTTSQHFTFTFTFALRLLCGLSMFWNTFQCSQHLSLFKNL